MQFINFNHKQNWLHLNYPKTNKVRYILRNLNTQTKKSLYLWWLMVVLEWIAQWGVFAFSLATELKGPELFEIGLHTNRSQLNGKSCARACFVLGAKKNGIMVVICGSVHTLLFFFFYKCCMGCHVSNIIFSFMKPVTMMYTFFLKSQLLKSFNPCTGPSELPGTPGTNPWHFLSFYVLSHATYFLSIWSKSLCL